MSKVIHLKTVFAEQTIECRQVVKDSLLIGVFLIFTNPLSSQVLARAAHRTGQHKSLATQVDRLAEDTGEE